MMIYLYQLRITGNFSISSAIVRIDSGIATLSGQLTINIRFPISKESTILPVIAAAVASKLNFCFTGRSRFTTNNHEGAFQRVTEEGMLM